MAASNFRTFYTPLNRQQDFIQAMGKVRYGCGAAGLPLLLWCAAWPCRAPTTTAAHQPMVLFIAPHPAPPPHPPAPHPPAPPRPQARAFAARLSRELRLRVYSYSLFHVFFEQYLTAGRDAAGMLGLPLLAVGGVAWGLGGSAWSAGLLLAVLASLLVHLGGAMLVAGIQARSRRGRGGGGGRGRALGVGREGAPAKQQGFGGLGFSGCYAY